MAEVSAIEWTDATFNPWIGCTKISPACDHCYAEDWAKRYGWPAWGGERRRTSASTWRQPVKLNAKAIAEGRRIRVFCASLADVFDNQVPAEWRDDLWSLIRTTPALDWLLLTKRPQNIAKMLPADWGAGYPNVSLGTTVEDQERADKRIPALLAAPAVRRFLSCEPLLGAVDLQRWLERCHGASDGDCFYSRCPQLRDDEPKRTGRHCPLDSWHDWRGGDEPDHPLLDWVITGGESGAQARPSHPDWFRSLRDQCAAAGVPFLFKQWGEWLPVGHHQPGERVGDRCHVFDDGLVMARVGKKTAGRFLDGVLHDAFPHG